MRISSPQVLAIATVLLGELLAHIEYLDASIARLNELHMSRFPSAAHLASWAGLCPGNNESAGKRKTGNTRKGNRWLKPLLVECGWGAGRARRTYLGARYARLGRRRGEKKAAIAGGHSILVAAYYIL